MVVKSASVAEFIQYKAPFASTDICVLSPDVPTKDAKVSCLTTAETPIRYWPAVFASSSRTLIDKIELSVAAPDGRAEVATLTFKAALGITPVCIALSISSTEVLIADRLTSSVAITTLCEAADLLPEFESTSVPAIFWFTFK